MSSRRSEEKKSFIVSEVYSLESVMGDLNGVLRKHLVQEENYKEDTRGIDIRILLGFLSGVISLLLFIFFKEKNLYTCRFFLFLFWGLVYLENFVSRFFFSSFFCGHGKKGKIRVITKIDSPNPFYTILVYFNDKKIPSKVTIDIREIYNNKHHLDVNGFISLVRPILHPAMQAA